MSIDALTCGYCLSASTAALQKNGRNDSFTPSRASKAPLTRARSVAIRVTSTSMTVVNCAEVCSDSTMRSAMTLRSRDIFSVRPRSADGAAAAVAAAGADGGAETGAGAAGAGAAASLAFSAASRTSDLRIRPPTPVPVTVARSTPCWAARRRTRGVT